MPGKCLSSRLGTVCEDIILLGAAGSNVRVSLVLLLFKPLDMWYTGGLWPPKEGKQIPCGAGLLLFGKTLLRTVHSSLPLTILIFILKSFITGL